MSLHREPSCHVTPRDVQRVFDGDLRDPELLAHIESCDTCSGRLAGLHSRREALAVLSGARTADQRVLRSAGRIGRVVLADTLAELLGELQTARARAAAGDAPGIEGAAEALATLLALATRLAEDGDADAAGLLVLLPAQTPTPGVAAALYRPLLAVLAAIEGDSPRVLRLRREQG